MSEKTAKEERREERAAAMACPNPLCPSKQNGGGAPERVLGLRIPFIDDQGNLAGALMVHFCLTCRLPFLHEKTASDIIRSMEQRVIVPRVRPVIPKVGGLIKAVK